MRNQCVAPTPKACELVAARRTLASARRPLPLDEVCSRAGLSDRRRAVAVLSVLRAEGFARLIPAEFRPEPAGWVKERRVSK